MQIKGESVAKGYEKWIQATSINSGGKNNTQPSFTMQVSGASADLKKAMAIGELLSKGEVYVVTPGAGAPSLLYTVKMGQIAVLSCTETMGCNNMMNTTVNLQATRIGWTYYQSGRTGIQTISRKFGWDAESKTEWTNF
jgi:type VI protein secretion system component Hcp